MRGCAQTGRLENYLPSFSGNHAQVFAVSRVLPRLVHLPAMGCNPQRLIDAFAGNWRFRAEGRGLPKR